MMNEMTVRENKQLGEKCIKVHHRSGLNIYYVPKKLTTSFAVFATRYGSVDSRFRFEGDEEFTVVPDGIAHFLEHKMFENEDGVDAFELFGQYGANANAFTSFDKTAYLFSATENFYECLEILLSFVTHPYFTPETVEKEQGIIGQEIAMIADKPDNALIYGLLGAMYKDHNVRVEIAGSVDSIAKITAPLLYECCEKFYNLNNMALFVSGDKDIDRMIDICDKVLVKADDFKVECKACPEEATVFKKKFENKMQVPTPMFAIGVKDTAISDDPVERMRKRAAMQIISDCVFGGSGEFYNEHYENGTLMDDLDVWAEHNRSFSFITVSGRGPDPEKLFADYRAQIEKIKREGLPREDLERCKKLTYSDFVRTFDSTAGIAYSIMEFALDGADMLDYPDIVGSLDHDEMNRLFCELFCEENTSYAVIYPIESEN